MKNLSLLTRKILALCGALVLAFLDQFIKYLVVILISPMNLPQVEVIPGVLSLTYVDNPGIAWSMFMDHPEVLTIATALLMAVLVLFFFTKFVRSGALMIYLMLILGGGLGNLADRVFRGSVVDYLRVEFINFPVFNLADCLVVVGVLLALVWLSGPLVPGRKAKPAPARRRAPSPCPWGKGIGGKTFSGGSG